MKLDGVRFTVNEIVLLFDKESLSFSDVLNVAKKVNGIVTGAVVAQGLYKIEVTSDSVQALETKLLKLEEGKQLPLQYVTANFLMDTQ